MRFPQLLLAEITLDVEPWTLAFVFAACAAVLALSALAWWRNEFRLGTGLLELLRVVLVVLAGITLLAPEWRQSTVPDEKPVLAVLSDVSDSMGTRDVETSPGAVSTRREHLATNLGAEAFSGLSERVDVVRETFSSADGSGGTDIDGALRDLLRRHANLRAVVLASDGDWNVGESPLTAATELRTRGVPVFSVGIGRETPLPDVEVAALDPPTFSVVGKSLQVPFSIRSTLARDHRATVTLTIDGSETRTKEVLVPARGVVRDMFFWRPAEIGRVKLSLAVPQHPNEVIADNNARDVDVTIRSESLKVLVVESYPRWEYRYLRNALERDPGVEVSCLLFHPGLPKRGGGSGYLSEFPETLEELARYDVVFLGDVGVGPDQLTPEQCARIRGLVEQQASGLVLLPGFRGHQASLLTTELRDLYPVVLDAETPRGFGSPTPGRFLLTESGRRNLLTKLADVEGENQAVWRGLPGFQWRSPAVRAKAGTDVLAIDELSRAPLLVTKPRGTGKVLFMGTDGAWRWREGVEDKYHYRFWGQVARWMAYQRHMAEGELLRLFYSPERPSVDSVVTWNATVLDPTGTPFDKATVFADVTDPAGAVTRLRFRSAGGDWGLYSAKLQPDRPGVWKVRLTCEETGAVLDTEVTVGGEVREVVGKPARHDVMREIAQVSRGEFLTPDRIVALRDKVLAIPDPAPWITRWQVWASPLWAGSLIFLLAVFWVGRKLIGTV